MSVKLFDLPEKLPAVKRAMRPQSGFCGRAASKALKLVFETKSHQEHALQFPPKRFQSSDSDLNWMSLK